MPPKVKAADKHAQVRRNIAQRSASKHAQSSRSTRSNASTSTNSTPVHTPVHTPLELFVPPELRSTTQSTSSTPETAGSGVLSSRVVQPSQPTTIRSIRIKEPVAQVPTAGSLGNLPTKKRGVVTGKSITKEIASRGGRRLTIGWDEVDRVPIFEKVCGYLTCTKFIGAIVRSYLPMTKSSYGKHERSETEIVINQLSVNYEFDVEHIPLYNWIQHQTGELYRSWKRDCGKEYEKGGKFPIPIEFVHRPHEWDWLCDHFETEEFKKLSEQMKGKRASVNKVNHTSGPHPYYLIGLKYRNEGVNTPHSEALAKSIESRAPETAAKVRMAANEAHAAHITKLQEAHTDETTSLDISKIQLPLDMEIEVIQKSRRSSEGNSAGTRVRGLGGAAVRDARQRGPARGVYKSSVNCEDLEKRLQQAEERGKERDEELRVEKERNKRMEERLNEQALISQNLTRQMQLFLESSTSQNSIGNSAM